MAEAPAAQQLLTQVRSQLQGLRDQKQNLQAQIDDVNSKIAVCQAIRDDCLAYIAYKGTQP